VSGVAAGVAAVLEVDRDLAGGVRPALIDHDIAVGQPPHALASARRSTPSTGSPSGGTSARKCFSIIAGAHAVANGGVPASSSYAITPTEDLRWRT
jgi:hypothetical protein